MLCCTLFFLLGLFVNANTEFPCLPSAAPLRSTAKQSKGPDLDRHSILTRQIPEGRWPKPPLAKSIGQWRFSMLVFLAEAYRTVGGTVYVYFISHTWYVLGLLVRFQVCFMLVVRSEGGTQGCKIRDSTMYIQIGRSNIEYEEPLATWMS